MYHVIKPGTEQHIWELPPIDVTALRSQLFSAQDEFGKRIMRTAQPESPHMDSIDYWLRFNDYKLIEDIPFDGMNNEHAQRLLAWLGPHHPVWYPEAYRVPAVFDIARQCMYDVRGEHLGGCLIVRVPPGKSVGTHVDTAWHATFHSTKVLIQINGAKGQHFYHDNEYIEALTGDRYIFNNQIPHGVINHSTEDWVGMVCSIKAGPR